LVRFWDIEIDKAIKVTKMRIKHHEKHGCGETAMRDKKVLQKQERHKELRDELYGLGKKQ